MKLNTNQLGQSCSTAAQVKQASCGGAQPSLEVIKEFKTSALVRESAQHYLTDLFRERKKENMKEIQRCSSKPSNYSGVRGGENQGQKQGIDWEDPVPGPWKEVFNILTINLALFHVLSSGDCEWYGEYYCEGDVVEVNIFAHFFFSKVIVTYFT